MQGVVTSFVIKTHPQAGGVWVSEIMSNVVDDTSAHSVFQGGIIIYGPEQYPAFAAAFDKFVTTVKDPKAAILPTYNWILGNVSTPSLPRSLLDSDTTDVDH